MASNQTLPARQTGNPNGQGQIVLAGDSVSLKGLMDRAKSSIAAALPKHLNADKLIKVALVAVSRNELLSKCTATSILQCVMTGAQLGLDCSGVLGSAYMVPFWNKKVNAYEATFIPGYRGLIDLARRSGQISSIEAHVVYAEDEFDFEYGLQRKLRHRPNMLTERSDDNIIAAYMVAFLRDGGDFFEVMTRQELLKIRDSSKGYQGKYGPQGPWHDHFSEMCRKTAVRRGIKYLPLSVEMQEALQIDNDNNAKLDGVIDGETVGDAMKRAESGANAINRKLQQESTITVTRVEEATGSGGAPFDGASEAGEQDGDTDRGDAEGQDTGGEGDNGSSQPAGPDVSTVENFSAAFDDACKAANIDVEKADTGLNKALLRIGKKGKLAQTPIEWRQKLIVAIGENRFNFATGEITEAVESTN